MSPPNAMGTPSETPVRRHVALNDVSVNDVSATSRSLSPTLSPSLNEEGGVLMMDEIEAEARRPEIPDDELDAQVSLPTTVFEDFLRTSH